MKPALLAEGLIVLKKGENKHYFKRAFNKEKGSISDG